MTPNKCWSKTQRIELCEKLQKNIFNSWCPNKAYSNFSPKIETTRQLHLDENLHQRLFARVCILCSFQKGYLVHLVEEREGAVIAGGQSSFAIPISRLVSTIKFNHNSYYGRAFQLLFLFFSLKTFDI